MKQLEVRMEQLRAFLMSSYHRANGDASDPMVLELSRRFDRLLNEWLILRGYAAPEPGGPE